MYSLRRLLTVPGALLIAALLFAACSSGEETDTSATGGGGDAAPASAAASAPEGGPGQPAVGAMGLQGQFQQDVELSITFTSPVFNEKRRIPKKATCIGGKVDRSGQSDKAGEMFARGNLTGSDAQNLSPPLDWTNVPEGTQSFALIVHSTEAQASDESWVHWLIWNLPADSTGLEEGIIEDPTLENGARQGLNSVGVVGYLGPCPPPPHQQTRLRSRRRLQPQAGDREVLLRGLRARRHARSRPRSDPTAADRGDGGPHPRRGRARRRATGSAEAAALAGRRLS